MADLVVYEKPSCTTCKNLATLLTERGVDFERVDYHVDRLPAEKIRELIGKAGLRPFEALRLREPCAAELVDAPDDEVIAAMAERPALLQRPFVERGGRAALARPVEKALELL